MHHGKLLSILRSVFNCPTAPFHEYHVRDHLLDLLDDLPHVSVEEDDFGNLIVELDGLLVLTWTIRLG